MENILRQPGQWRDKATEFMDMAQMTKDLRLREQFADLAARYLDMAERLESEVVAAGVLSARLSRR